MKLHIFTTMLIALSTAVVAQQKTQSKARPHFQTTVQVGVMEGQGGTALQYQIINGLRYKTFSAGLGVGVDNYQKRTVPIFVDLRKSLSQTDQAPFIYGDGGAQFPWPDKKEDEYTWGDVKAKEPGLFYECGLGYRIPFRSNAFIISAGYSFKQYSWTETYQVWCFMAPCPDQVNHYNLKLNRLSVKAGLSF